MRGSTGVTLAREDTQSTPLLILTSSVIPGPTESDMREVGGSALEGYAVAESIMRSAARARSTVRR